MALKLRQAGLGQVKRRRKACTAWGGACVKTLREEDAGVILTAAKVAAHTSKAEWGETEHQV
jgi:hypothetical protein